MVLLVTSCSTGDSWPETVYLDRLFIDGQEVSASPGNQSPWSYLVKNQDETRSSDTGYSEDSDLVISLDDGKKYDITFIVIYSSPAAADFHSGIWYDNDTVNGLTLLTGTVQYQNLSSTPVQGYFATYYPGSYSGIFSSFGNDTAKIVMVYKITVSLDGESNRFSFRWGQNSSNGGNTTVYAGSLIEWREIQ